jgi:hypothetical protein
VDVDIDADERQVAGDAQGQVGALGPDPGEGLQDLVVAGQLAAEFLDGALCQGLQLRRLALVEADRADQRVDLGRAGAASASGVRALANAGGP